jgi:hypothetical protein
MFLAIVLPVCDTSILVPHTAKDINSIAPYAHVTPSDPWHPPFKNIRHYFLVFTGSVELV